MNKNSKNALSLYSLEVLLGLSDVLMLAFSKYTFQSDSAFIKLACILYVAITFIIMFFITGSLVSNKAERVEKQEDNQVLVNQVTKLAAEKRLPEISTTVNVQARKLEDRADLIKKMLKENFSDDDSSGEISLLVEKYKDTFYSNLDKLRMRITIVDNSNLNVNLKVDTELKVEAREVYESHMAYISDKVNLNEKIVIELDKLLTELTRINDSAGANSLEQLQDYTAALKKINDSAVDESDEDEAMKVLMQKY